MMMYAPKGQVRASNVDFLTFNSTIAAWTGSGYPICDYP